MWALRQSLKLPAIFSHSFHIFLKRWKKITPSLYATLFAPETRSLIASRLSTENRHFRLYLTPVVRPKKYICTLKKLTGKKQATWLTYRERWFKWVTATGINLIIFEFANLWLDALNEGQVYPWVHRWRLILLVHIYTTHSPSAAKLSLR